MHLFLYRESSMRANGSVLVQMITGPISLDISIFNVLLSKYWHLIYCKVLLSSWLKNEYASFKIIHLVYFFYSQLFITSHHKIEPNHSSSLVRNMDIQTFFSLFTPNIWFSPDILSFGQFSPSSWYHIILLVWKTKSIRTSVFSSNIISDTWYLHVISVLGVDECTKSQKYNLKFNTIDSDIEMTWLTLFNFMIVRKHL